MSVSEAVLAALFSSSGDELPSHSPLQTVMEEHAFGSWLVSREHRASALLYSESVARLLPGGGVDPVTSCSI